ncbi:MAG: glycosyl transferase family 1 [Firmicutes bacterium HGW-Firmicutes-14]|nr:MAG: glycosyl transferase family 1 [Firmicutes bacterium HGW-Firmicutes-14]
MKVLISAYACEPNRGSEPGVGWNNVRQISTYHEVWVITRTNNRENIEEVLKNEPLSNVKWIYFDLPTWARFWKKKRRGIQLYYYMWQIGAYLLAKQLHRQIQFDLVHHVTFVKYWTPSLFVRLPIPFIWGPVGGGESAPQSFYGNFSLRGKIYEFLRDLARWLAEHDPLVRLTAQQSSLVLATTNETKNRLKKIGVKKIMVWSEAGLSDEDLEKLGQIKPREYQPIRFISMGNLVHLKGYDLGLRAFAEANCPHSEYWILGDGPERKRLENIVIKYNLLNRVKFWGALPRMEALQKLAECDVLVHPSLHDSGGWVCLEAMAAGKPVICMDLGGPATQVTNKTGYKIPALNPDQAIRDIAKSMLKLANDMDLRVNMGKEGRARINELFEWRKKGLFLKKVYDDICQDNAVMANTQGSGRN